MHLARHPEDHIGYVGVIDSSSFVKFGNQQMAKPCKRAKLVSWDFLDLKLEEVKERKQRIGAKMTTLSGIKSNFEYVSHPDGKVSLICLLYLMNIT